MYALIPSLIFLVIVILQTLLGFKRGKRKSIYLLINFAIAFVITVIIFNICCGLLSSESIVSQVKDVLGVENGETTSEVIANYLLGGENTVLGSGTEVILMTITMLLRFVLFIVMQIVVFTLVKFILYLIYLIAFRRKVKDYNEDFGKGRGIGALIGAFRGVIVGFLIFSQLSTLLFIVSGGIFYTSEEYDDYVKEDIFFGYDDIYKSIKTSRDTGLGKVFESIKIGGTPIDYLFMDAVLQDEYIDYNKNSIDFLGREELGYTIGIITKLYESGVISYEDGNIALYPENATDDVITSVFGNLSNLQTMTKVLPTLLIEYSETLDDFPIVLTGDMLDKVNFQADIKGFGSIICSLLQIIDYSQLQDFENFDYMGLDPEAVDKLISDICKITLLTQLAIPLGIDYVFEQFEGLVFDFNSIVWNEDLQNLKGLYGLVQDLNLDFALLGDMDYLESLLKDSDSVDKIDAIIVKLFNSDFMFEVASSFMLYQLESLSESNDIVASLNFDIDNYSKEMLQEDVSLMINTLVEGYSVYELLSNGDLSVDTLFSTDLGPLQDALVGKFEGDVQVSDGLMDLNILAGAGNDFYGGLFSMIPSFSELIGDVQIDDWRTEFRSMFDALGYIQEADLDIESLSNGDLSALTPVAQSTVDGLIDSIHSSKIVSTMFVGILTDTLGSIDLLTVPEDIEWYGEDGELDSLLNTIFFFVNEELIADFMGGSAEDITSAIIALSEEDLALVCKSIIIHSTISEQITSATEGTPLIIDEYSFTDGLINISELSLLLEFINANGMNDFTNIDIDSISLFTDANITLIQESNILSKTIVNQLTTMEMISTPVDLADYTNSAWYGQGGELDNLLIGLQSLFGNSTINEIEFDIQIILNSKDGNNEYPIFESATLRFTVSDQLLNLTAGESSFLTVPASVYETYLGSTMITESELNALLNALDTLNINDFDNLDLSLFFDNTINYDNLFNSEILRVTTSKNVIDTNVLTIPTSIKDSENNITKTELVALLNAIRSLGITDFETIDLTMFFGRTEVEYNTMFESVILAATTSDNITDLNTLEIPQSVMTGDYINSSELVNLLLGISALNITDFSSIDLTMFFGKTEAEYNTMFESVILAATTSINIEKADGIDIPTEAYSGDYISSSELTNLFLGLQELNLTSFDTTNSDAIFSSLNSESVEVAVQSIILHKTLSNVMLDSLTVVTEYYGEAVVVDGVITKDEIIALMNSLEILGIENLNDFANINTSTMISKLSGLSTAQVNELVESSIISVQISAAVISINSTVVTKDETIYGSTDTVKVISKETLATEL